MSRRTFLENMRQEVRKRDASDPDSPHNTHSGNSSTPQLSLEATVSPTQTPTTATAPAVATPPIAVVAANTAVAADTPLQENALLGTHMTEFTTVSATTIVSPRTLTPPPPDTVGRHQDDPEAAGGAGGEGAGRVSGRPTLSPDVLHVDDAIAVQEQPFGADTPPSWQGQQATRRSSSHTQHGRSSSHATVPDVLVTPRRSSLRRSSMPRGSISQSRRSGSVSSSSAAALKKRQSSGPATAAAAASAAAAARRQSRERASSVGRMEASLIALQVELATEKRNNIEAEHHIMTLNAEVEMLRRENGRLSREVAEAATQAAAHHASHKAGAAATAEAAVAVGGPAAAAALVGDAAVAATRIEALEARLQELSRNLETKQRELDTKDERVRLLEHKLADTLLLQSGVHYMAVPGGPAGAPGQPGQTAYYYPAGMPPSVGYPAGQQGSNNASQSGSRSPLSSGSPASPVNGRAAPRRLWQGDAPNTATAGPRVGAIRSIASLGAGQHAGEAPAHPRAGSAVRKRSPVGHSEGPTDSLQQLTALPARETANAARTPTPPPSSAADAAGGGRGEGRAGSAQRRDGARPPSVRRSSARRKTSAASRTSSVDHTASGASPAAARDAASVKRSGSTVEDGREAVTPQSTATSVHRASTSSALRARASTAQRSPSTGLSARRSSALRRTSTAATDTTDNFRHSNSGHGTTVAGGGGVARTNSLVGRLGGPGAASPTRAGYPGHVGVSSSMYNHNSHSNGTTSSGNGGGLASAHSVYAKNQRALSTYRNARAPSATRSIAQRSSTSLRSRPQIAFSADGDTSTMRGTTTTVTFRTRESRAGNLSVNSNNNSAVDSAAPPPPPVAMASGGRFAAESSALI